jgi:outer membrane biosynthesis protein TonB
VPARKGTRRRARKQGLAGLAVLGTTVIAGLLAAWGVNPVEPSELAPADVVALRFPPDWMNSDETTGSAQAAAPAAATFTLASASDTRVDTTLMFNPYQTYPTQMAALAAPAPQPSTVAPALSAPEAKAEPKPETKPVPKLEPKADARPETKPEPKTAAVPTRSVAAASPPQHKPAPRARKDSGELFNDAQLASIKTRLKLTAYQEQYWPPVENALRAIGRAVSRGGTPKTTALGYASEGRLAQIDPDSDEVQQLKSAAFPLIMSMNDDQKQQVRNIAHVMGLERVASSF